jgi:hypothetical protein
LAEIGVDRISDLLKAAVPHGRLVLCCFESLETVPPEEQQFVCHRRALVSWWQQMAGDLVPELSDQPEP